MAIKPPKNTNNPPIENPEIELIVKIKLEPLEEGKRKRAQKEPTNNRA